MAGLETLEKLKQRTREAIPLRLARFVYLASLRDYNTDRYEHAGWAFQLTEDGADQALREFHLEEFRSLVSCLVREIAEELRQYFETQAEPTEKLLSTWQEVESYRVLVPRNCNPVDRGIFFSTVRAALIVLAEWPSALPPAPRFASPPPSLAQ